MTIINWSDDGLGSTDGRWRLQVEHVRGEGVWCYVEAYPPGAEAVRDREDIETCFHGPGARARVRRACAQIEAVLRREAAQ